MSAAMDRTTFRDAVAAVAEKAHAKLPACTGRIDAAVKMVLAGDVELLADGTARVASRSDARKSYSVNGVCTCVDYGRAPGNLCAHRLAYGIMRRASELVPAQPAPPAVLLPEARVSVNVRISVHGHDAQVALRGETEDEVLARLEAVLTRYAQPLPPAPSQDQPLTPQQHNAAAMHKRVSDFCKIHSVPMQLNQKAGRSWWSHRTAEGWCKGR